MCDEATRSSGMLTIHSYMKLLSSQCRSLTDEYHIYLPANGRINIAGLNKSCTKQVALAIDAVVRKDLNRATIFEK